MNTESPEMPPPPGVALDPMHSESLSPYNTLCQVVCLGLATTAVALRVFTTLKVVRQWRIDDCEIAILTKSWHEADRSVKVSAAFHG